MYKCECEVLGKYYVSQMSDFYLLWDFLQELILSERIRGEFRGSPFLSHVVQASVGKEQLLLKPTQTHTPYLH